MKACVTIQATIGTYTDDPEEIFFEWTIPMRAMILNASAIWTLSFFGHVRLLWRHILVRGNVRSQQRRLIRKEPCVARWVRQDASETLRPYSLSSWIAIKECSKRNSFSPGVVAVCSNEKERTYKQTNGVGPVPYLWVPCRTALCAAFGRFALGDTSRTKVPHR